MSRTNVVKMLSKEQKSEIYTLFLSGKFKSKKSLAKEVGISTRTLGRIIKELEITLPEDCYDYSVTKTQITIFKGDDSRSVVKGYPKFKTIKETLIQGDFSDKVLKESFEMLYLPTFVEKFSEGNITVDHENGKVWYGSFEIKNTLTDHLLKGLEQKEDINPFVRFVNLLMSNPKKDIVEELYGFMKHYHMDISEDGHILAYKGVRPNFKDWWTNTISNKTGEAPCMPSHEVEHDPSKGCGAGLHCGSYQYASSWARNGHVMKVKVDPRDVISVPWDCDSQKMRTCGYEVLEEVINND